MAGACSVGRGSGVCPAGGNGGPIFPTGSDGQGGDVARGTNARRVNRSRKAGGLVPRELGKTGRRRGEAVERKGMEAVGLDHRSAEPVSNSLANSSLVVEKIDTLEQLLALQPQWRELELASGNALPFRTSDWAIGWWTNFRESRAAVSDSLFVRALRTRSGQLVAVAPMVRTERPAVGPFRVKVLQFFGPDGYVTELNGPLCLPAFEEQVIHSLLDHLRASASSWDWMLWRGLRLNSPWERAVATAGSVEWGEEVPGYILPLA